MNETLQFLAQHDYWLLIGAVLGRQACLPIPANLLFVAAGAMARSGKLSLPGTVGISILAFLLADFAWYEAGRELGDRVLHFVCGLSPEPGSCVHRATSVFSKQGVRILLVSKFVVGLDAVAAPLAGRARISAVQFLIFDALGAALWTSTYTALGYIFSNRLDRVATHLVRTGAFLALAVAVVLGFYLTRKFVRWYRFVREFSLARITPEQLHEKLTAGEDVLVVDLQGHHTGAEGIPGAVRINPRALEQYKDVQISPSRQVVLYCACPGEYTSARVALALREKGVEHVRPLAGGLIAWRSHGFPVSPEVALPVVPNVPTPAVN